MHVTDTHVDAAQQVLDKHDRVIELAEMMIRCSDETPQEHANDQGVRITIVGEDPVAESGHKVTHVGRHFERSDAGDSDAASDVTAGHRTATRQG